jgi:hypothetical protein
MTWLTSPMLIDFVILFTVVEACVLRAFRYRPVVAMLLPGICLLLALRAALAGAAWPWVPMALTAALAAHLWDVRLRWRS